jgi:DNA-binding transcriptional LysR family regulator
MDVKDLRYFVAAYEARNFSHAAERLNTVQPNVSLRIHNLEAHFKARLFGRSSHGVVPTMKAKALYQRAKRAITALLKVERAVRPDRVAGARSKCYRSVTL